jgi:hypothetical protein
MRTLRMVALRQREESNFHAPPSDDGWLIVNVTVRSGTETVPLRAGPVFAATERSTEPLAVPLAAAVTVIHDAFDAAGAKRRMQSTVRQPSARPNAARAERLILTRVMRQRHVAALAICIVATLSGAVARVQSPGTFAAQIADLSEPGGYFDTDNLISNERSYLRVLPELARRNVHGGAYVGVGPDQNFSYIAEIRPSIAFILDVRRDNLLLHLLFKALFVQARTRLEYLSLLFGRTVPGDVARWRAAPIEQIARYVEQQASAQPLDSVRGRVDAAVKSFGVPLSAADLATIDRFHRRFIDAGLDLRFQSTGRPPQFYYPTYRDLLVETDGEGHQRNYLASEESFQFVKGLETRDRVIPVVGNLGGPSAMAAVARALAARHEQLSAFYVSNVEFYLERDGTYQRFATNLARMPRTSNSVIIRSIFGRGGGSMSELQPIAELLAEAAISK